MNANKPYRRILLKLSGEMLMGDQQFGIDQSACRKLSLAIKKLHDSGLEIAIVIGGGNIFRGFSLEEMGLQRTPADHMGMLSTMINGIALQQALLNASCPTKVMSALECPKAVNSYNWGEAMAAIQDNVLIFVGGTGNPLFTTDTAAALRANEIGADALLKATKVDGIYDKDPIKFTDATKYETLTYSRALAEKLAIMDATALAMCRNAQIPIFVFNMGLLTEETIINAIKDTKHGTLVQGD